MNLRKSNMKTFKKAQTDKTTRAQICEPVGVYEQERVTTEQVSSLGGGVIIIILESKIL